MFVIAAGDIDLSIGYFVSLITCIVAVVVPASPLLGVTSLVILVFLYAGIGALIHVRRLPSIVVTLAFPQGIWGASLFLYVLVNLLNVAAIRLGFGSAGSGIRFILTGLIIVFIVAISRDPE